MRIALMGYPSLAIRLSRLISKIFPLDRDLETLFAFEAIHETFAAHSLGAETLT